MFSLHFVPVFPAIGDVMFNISQTLGVLTVSGTLDRETVSRFIISVKVYPCVVFSIFRQLRRGVEREGGSERERGEGKKRGRDRGGKSQYPCTNCSFLS